MISRITLPPGPMISRILSVGTFMVMILGACLDNSARGSSRALLISPRIWSRPSFACCMALPIKALSSPPILISICRAVIPSFVPATLKSISPRWSSDPRMSDRIATSSPSLIRPMAIPATGFAMGTPASIRAREPPQTDAIEDDPFDSRMSETTRMVYGNFSLSGRTGIRARSASMPWPISLRPGLPINLVSPVQNAGKL